MQIEVHHVDTEIARPGIAQNGVEIGAVVVDEAAGFMNDIDDTVEVLVPETEGIRISNHQSGSVRPDVGLERFDDRHFRDRRKGS